MPNIEGFPGVILDISWGTASYWSYMLHVASEAWCWGDFPCFSDDKFLKISYWKVTDTVRDKGMLGFHVWEPLVIMQGTLFLKFFITK